MRGKFRLGAEAGAAATAASMRPAHCAREVSVQAPRWRPLHLGFNEARALCAGSFSVDEVDADPLTYASMRPAHCAREVSSRTKSDMGRQWSFNEARALCAGSFKYFLGGKRL